MTVVLRLFSILVAGLILAAAAHAQSPREATYEELELAVCAATQPVTQTELRRLGLPMQGLVPVRLNRGPIPGTSPTSAGDFQFIFYSKDAKRAWMAVGYVGPDSAIVRADGYRLRQTTDGWSVVDGNGGIATYAAVAAHVAVMERAARVEVAMIPSDEFACEDAVIGSPSDADWEWFSKVKEQALDSIMPTAYDRALVTYRSFHDLRIREHERYFSIQPFPLPGARQFALYQGTIVIPTARSIQHQLITLRMKDRSLSIEAALAGLQFRRAELDSEHCPALRQRMNALNRIGLSMANREDVLILHAIRHRFLIRTWAADIDTTIGDSEQPLVRWALETNAALTRCVISRP